MGPTLLCPGLAGMARRNRGCRDWGTHEQLTLCTKPAQRLVGQHLTLVPCGII